VLLIAGVSNHAARIREEMIAFGISTIPTTRRYRIIKNNTTTRGTFRATIRPLESRRDVRMTQGNRAIQRARRHVRYQTNAETASFV